MEEPYELPEGWAWTVLGQISEKPQYGWTTSASSNRDGLKLLRTTDISSGTINWSTVPVCSKIPENPSKYELKPGDIVVSRSGSVGISIEITECPKVIFASYLIRFKTIPPILPRYVSLFFKSPHYWSSIMDSTSGIAIPNVNATKLSNLKIPLPPLDEQRRIVAKLEALLAQMKTSKEHLAKARPIIQRFRQCVLAAACSGHLTEQWRKRHPDVESASELLQRIQEKQIRRYEEECRKSKIEGRKKPKKLEFQEINTGKTPELPEKWIWTYFNSLGELSRGRSRHRPRNDPRLFGGDYPYIQTGEVANSGGEITKFSQTLNEFGLAQSKLFPEGTVCITIAANIAESGILTFPACFPDSVVGFIPSDILIDGKFFEFYIRTIKDDLSRYAPATAQKNINLRILNQVIVPLPPLAEQRIIVKQVNKLSQSANDTEEHIIRAAAHTERLTQSILAKAFRGELVPQDPNDEPASMLLEKIKKEKSKLKKKKAPGGNSKTLLDFMGNTTKNKERLI